MTPFPALGIDVGKLAIHVCAPQPDTPAKKWPVTKLEYADPQWWRQLVMLAAPDAVVCFEPTGWHLSAPLVALFTQLTTAQVWLVGHGTTGRVREVHISNAKTDDMDARALALIASWVAEGKPPANTRRHNVELELHVQQLRSLVNDLHRVTRQQTRLKNRLHAFAHAIWPALDIRFTTWLKLANQGVITPADIKAYVAALPNDTDRRTTRPAEILAADLPDLIAPVYAVQQIIHTLQSLTAMDAEERRLRGQIVEICTRPPFAETTRRLLTMPGLAGDPCNIAPFHVACHGLLDVMHPDEVKASVGISAKTDTSGQGDKTRAMKGGYRPAGIQLYMWAQRLLSPTMPDNPVRDYYERLKGRNKEKPFRAARAKLAMLISGVARRPDGYTYIPQS